MQYVYLKVEGHADGSDIVEFLYYPFHFHIVAMVMKNAIFSWLINFSLR